MRWAKSLLISFTLSALGYLEFGVSFFDWALHVAATVFLVTMVLMVCFVDPGYYWLADVQDGYHSASSRLQAASRILFIVVLTDVRTNPLSISNQKLTSDPPC
jgi:hypothetical protein